MVVSPTLSRDARCMPTTSHIPGTVSSSAHRLLMLVGGNAAHVRCVAGQPRYPHHTPSQLVAYVRAHSEAIWQTLQECLGMFKAIQAGTFATLPTSQRVLGCVTDALPSEFRSGPYSGPSASCESKTEQLPRTFAVTWLVFPHSADSLPTLS